MYSKNDTNLIESGACWCYYKNIALGSTQGGPSITVENTTHEVLIDQNGNEVIAETGLGGKASAEVPMVETNPGLLAAIVPGAVAAVASAEYQSVPTGATYAAGEISLGAVLDDDVRVGDVVEYSAASGTVTGVLAQYDKTNNKIKLMDGNEAPLASLTLLKLYRVEGVRFHSNAGLNLKQLAGELIYIPKDTNNQNYHILPLAGINYQPESTFDNETERIQNLSFTGYPDATVEHEELGTGLVYFIGFKSAYDAL